MAKANIKIPKGTKCKNGEVCDKDLELEVEIPEVRPTIERIPVPEVDIPSYNQYAQQQYTQAPPPPVTTPPTNDEKSFTTDELADLMPTGVNFAVCKGKNCADSIIRNKKFTTKFKSCPKCGCNNVPYSSNVCPCCGKSANEEDEEYWEESEIEFDNEEEEE